MVTLPTVNDTVDLYTIYKYVGVVATGGLFWPVMLLVIWIVAFLGSLANGRRASVAWIFASFAGTILAILMGLLGFIAPIYIYFGISLVGIGVVWTKLTSGFE